MCDFKIFCIRVSVFEELSHLSLTPSETTVKKSNHIRMKFTNTINFYCYSFLFAGIFNTGFTSPDVATLRDCISVLFMFERRPVEDKQFKDDCRQWLDMLVSPHTTTS